MDTIHHLLRLNVEIEGALRVLANRDNEIAMKILCDKTHELYQMVLYLAHPEEDIKPIAEETHDIKIGITYETAADGKGCSERPSVFHNEDSPIVSKVESMSSPLSDDGSNQDLLSFDDHVVESEAIRRVLVPDNVNVSDEEVIEISNPSSDPDNRSDKTPSFSESQKDKLRIDEMLSRREARNLSKAFTINDRFRFQLHIFDGDKEAFNNTIEAISSMKDYESAYTYLSGILEIKSDDQDMTDFLAIIQNHFGIV